MMMRHSFFNPCWRSFNSYRVYNCNHVKRRLVTANAAHPVVLDDAVSPQEHSPVNSTKELSLSPILTLSHTPVMAEEVLSMLDIKPGQTILDMTFGAGGHSKRILDFCPEVRVLGLDRDPVAYSFGERLSLEHPERLLPLLGRFSELPQLLQENNIKSVDSILMDLGCSSMQFDTDSRGFSISRDGPLDMRMDGNRFPDQPTAADILEHIEEHHLAKIIKYYGEEKKAKKIAQAVIQARYMFQRLKTTSELASLVQSVLGSEQRLDKLARPSHVATKTFQAIRIFVNNEMNELNQAMEISHHILNPGGRIVALTFHSLEDRIVKRHFTGINMDEPISKSMSQKYRNALEWHTLDSINSIFDKKMERLK